MTIELEVKGKTVQGEFALAVAPGTLAKDRDREIDALLAGPLSDAADRLGVVMAAAPSAFARPLPGKDESGRVRFQVAGRVEGERLVPFRPR